MTAKKTPVSILRDLIDTDGENRAVRCFLQLYSSNQNPTISQMKDHLSASGFGGCWPEWAERAMGDHLTKGGAQDWIRHLFSLEAATASGVQVEPVAMEGAIAINPTQQNVLLAAAEALDDLGAPLNADDIRMILDTAPSHQAAMPPAVQSGDPTQLKFMDEIDAGRQGEAFLDSIQSSGNFERVHFVDDGKAQAPRLKWGALFDEFDNLRAAYLLTRDMKNWTQLTLYSASSPSAAPAPLVDKQATSAKNASVQFDSNMQKLHIPPAPSSGSELPPLREAPSMMVERLRNMRLAPCNDAADMIEILAARSMPANSVSDLTEEDRKAIKECIDFLAPAHEQYQDLGFGYQETKHSRCIKVLRALLSRAIPPTATGVGEAHWKELAEERFREIKRAQEIIDGLKAERDAWLTGSKGWQIVPVRATREMIDSIEWAFERHSETHPTKTAYRMAEEAYGALLAASPLPNGGEG